MAPWCFPRLPGVGFAVTRSSALIAATLGIATPAVPGLTQIGRNPAAADTLKINMGGAMTAIVGTDREPTPAQAIGFGHPDNVGPKTMPNYAGSAL
jgi:hypothetical protein